MATPMNRVQAAVIDGTAQSPRFKQRQLVKLHDALVDSRVTIVDAIRKDHGYSQSEAHVHFHLVMTVIRDLYCPLSLEQLLADEYSIANSKDNVQRRKAVGCAYIIASQPVELYSIVVPMAAAIAAGNCIILQIQQTSSALSTLLRRMLPAALDINTFTFVESGPEQAFIDRYCITVNTEPGLSTSPSLLSLSGPEARVVAVVDRSADLEAAAREIIRARFSFRGQAPYAPDLVLVNEFCMKEFCSAVAQCTLPFRNGSADKSAQEPHPRNPRARASASFRKGLADTPTTTLLSGSRGSVILVHERSSELLSSKIGEPVVLIHAISSMDDAIDLVNSTATPLLATYLFSAPSAAKYLGQFIDARLFCVNHIPVELLVGPPSPQGYRLSIHPRYTTEMFSKASPEHISLSKQSSLLARIVDDQADGGSEAAARLETTLTPMNEPSGRAINFFDQGLITGASLVVSSVLVSIVLTAKYVVPTLRTRFGLL